MFCRLVYIISHVFIPFQTRYTFRLLGWALSRDTDHMMYKPSPNSAGFGEATGNICGRIAALLVSDHFAVLFEITSVRELKCTLVHPATKK